MEGSQPLLYQSSIVTEYTSSDHVPAENMATNSDSVMSDGNLVHSVSSGATAHSSLDGSGTDVGNTYSHDLKSVSQEAATGVVYEANASAEHMAGISAQVVGYDAANGSISEMANYQSIGAMENGSVPTDTSGAIVQQAYEDVVYSAEEDRLWNMVRANCLDFNSWIALIEETEKVAENNIVKIRKVYDAFLAEFPLCYGYWKKYADHEGRLDSVEKVVEVYERAVLAVTYSVEIWLHYAVFTISTYEDPDIIRRLFERGLAYVGTDYQSYQLWDEYIRYEESHQAWSNLAMIYTRILENPIQQLDRYFNCFKELAASRPLSEIRTAEEAAVVASTLETGGQALEDEVHDDGVEQSSKPLLEGHTSIGDDFNKVVKLYERCLIACANYPEFWMRYVLCMEVSGSMELANNALARATQVFVKKQPEIHLFAARFKEFSGDIVGARTQYQILYSEVSPGLLEAFVRHANMEYRLGEKEAAFSVYQTAISAEQGKEQSQLLPLLLVQYSRFLYLVVGDADKGREVLSGHLENMQLSRPVLEAVIHLESIQPLPKRVDYLDSLVEKFITPNPENPNLASTIDREEISCIFLEFLDHFGDAQSIKKADNRHALLFQRQKSMLVSKKRYAEDFLSSDKAKMAKNFSEAGQSVMGAYPNAQSQWPAGYGQKAPVWPTTTQPQVQWNPGYASQAGYAAYGGYSNYGQQQVATSAPQGTAYGAYPPTYPVEAYPQPSYAQPTAAPTINASWISEEGCAKSRRVDPTLMLTLCKLHSVLNSACFVDPSPILEILMEALKGLSERD
ncbi:hypothetical protein OPV22_030359 [Ensete ventricosum]|uniref:Suppressor of forked domain-containing protein n=1 Tax=Ensete ventricosum TaxID=4639 RepID=A0AAV8P621_ENSVE|nr:hypothetical protein OPV22_030359 [Ensete ventricosum]